MSKFDKILIIELIVSMIMFIVVAVMLFSLSGCQLVTVQVHQRTIVDVGDGAKNIHSAKESRTDYDKESLTIPLH